MSPTTTGGMTLQHWGLPLVVAEAAVVVPVHRGQHTTVVQAVEKGQPWQPQVGSGTATTAATPPLRATTVVPVRYRLVQAAAAALVPWGQTQAPTSQGRVAQEPQVTELEQRLPTTLAGAAVVALLAVQGEQAGEARAGIGRPATVYPPVEYRTRVAAVAESTPTEPNTGVRALSYSDMRWRNGSSCLH